MPITPAISHRSRKQLVQHVHPGRTGSANRVLKAHGTETQTWT